MVFPVPDPPEGACLGGLRILVVDDHSEICELIAEVLREDGHVVVSADSGAQARALLEGGERADVVLADVRMPGVGGAALVRWIRASEHRHVRVVLMSASPPPRDVQGEADAFLPKPFELAALVAAVYGR